MSRDHTPAPWSAEPGKETHDHVVVGEGGLTARARVMSAADYERACLCVNACGDAEAGVLSGMGLTRLVARLCMTETALEKLLDCVEASAPGAFLDPAVVGAAREALARSKGAL